MTSRFYILFFSVFAIQIIIELTQVLSMFILKKTLSRFDSCQNSKSYSPLCYSSVLSLVWNLFGFGVTTNFKFKLVSIPCNNKCNWGI